MIASGGFSLAGARPAFEVTYGGTRPPFCVLNPQGFKEAAMGRGLLLWLLGVPIPVIILLWLFFGH